MVALSKKFSNKPEAVNRTISDDFSVDKRLLLKAKLCALQGGPLEFERSSSANCKTSADALGSDKTSRNPWKGTKSIRQHIASPKGHKRLKEPPKYGLKLSEQRPMGIAWMDRTIPIPGSDPQVLRTDGAESKRAAPPGRCHSCNRSETLEWRGPDGARTLCNACGMHYAKLTHKRQGLVSEQAAANTRAGGTLVPRDHITGWTVLH